MRRSTLVRLVTPLAIAVSGAGVAALPLASQAATPATAAATPQIQYRGDSAGQDYTVTVKAGSTAIKSVAVAKSSNQMTVTSCSTSQPGWSASRISGACTYATSTNPIPANGTGTFKAHVTTLAGSLTAANKWIVYTSGATTGAGASSAGETTKNALLGAVFPVQVTDVKVRKGAKVNPGQPCPAPVAGDHTAPALSAQDLVVCGVNWGTATFAPNGNDSTLVGSFAVQSGTLDVGSVGAGKGSLAAPVVLANYTGALIGPNAGTGKTLAVWMVQSKSTAAPVSSQPAVLGGYTVLCPTDYVVSPTGSDANSGTCTAPFKTITHAMSVAGSAATTSNAKPANGGFVRSSAAAPAPPALPSFTKTVLVLPGTYNTASGETFPINVPAGVGVAGDVAKFGSDTIVSGAMNLGAGAVIGGFSVNGGAVSLGNNAQAWYSQFTNHPSNVADTTKTCLDVTGTGVQLFTVLAHDCSYGAIVRAGQSATVRGSYFLVNTYGVRLEPGAITTPDGSADLGTASSLGGNTLSCAINADLWTSASAVNAVGNIWDNSPPTKSVAPTGGTDVARPLLTTVDTSQSSQVTFDNSPCTNVPLPF